MGNCFETPGASGKDLDTGAVLKASGQWTTVISNYCCNSETFCLYERRAELIGINPYNNHKSNGYFKPMTSLLSSYLMPSSFRFIFALLKIFHAWVKLS